MFLKRLDVAGFKSFADKISVDFVQGMTAVVGPNGSGKSNITDSIRWVLGEQSARSLRGAKMEDVIFAGSDTRKALNVAEVTLTLENSEQFLPIDYHEVSITRRVFRSGESEFFINNQHCRLKDIIDLFMDSGLGRESFSIIGQGRVEEVLSSKSDERRKIFEEAAGVLKYKLRKKKAELKLVETQDNLNRVSDILYEIESGLEPLKIQASMAKDYLEKKAELKNYDISLTVYEIEELHKKWEKLKLEHDHHKQLSRTLSESITKKESHIDEAQKNMNVLEQSLEELQTVLLNVSEELEKIQGRKQVLIERKKHASKTQDELEESTEHLEEQVAFLAKSKEEASELLKTYEQNVHRLKKELSEKQALFESYSEDLDEKLENLKSDYFEKAQQETALRNERQFLLKQIEQNSERQNRLKEANKELFSEHQKLEGEHKSLDGEVSTAKEEFDQAVNENLTLKRDVEALTEKYRKKESLLYQAYQYVEQTKSKRSMMEDMQDGYTGYFQGVKEVLKARESALTGIEGAVAELITVPKEVETALETALGGAMQHIVVSAEEQARKAIAYLKKRGSGRATFLPLSTIKGKSIPHSAIETMQGSPSFVGVARDLISYEQKYENIVSNLLGTVIVTKDLRGANELARLVSHRYRFVTLEGDVVNPGGSMSGGASKKNSSSLIARKRELEDLVAKLAEMEEKTGLLEAEVKELKTSLAQAEKQSFAQGEKVQTLKEKYEALNAKMSELLLTEKNTKRRLEMYNSDMTPLFEEQERFKQREAELRESLQASQEDMKHLDEEIQLVTEQKNSEKSSKETVQGELTNLKIALAEASERLVYQREKVERAEQDLYSSSTALSKQKDQLSFLKEQMKEGFTSQHDLEDTLLARTNDKEETAKLISERRKQRTELQEELETFIAEQKELKRQQEQMMEALKDEEVQINRFDVELDQYLNMLREEYMLSFEAAKQQYPLTLSPEETRKKIRLIKLALDELGTVNIGAIEEYERVSERYTFLSEQKEDLVEAKDTLHQLIEEMDTEMKKRFSETFTSVREHFKEVFTKLFGGGRADLKLTDQEDLLNTGIDIVAQPPGKKLQNLALLSGGERSLTAIALLFAILKVRPVPFCVLDEVEAALDEANVQRFAKFIKTFSEKTQFIVITHRKGTMEEADVLYGVTMQESGVSKLVSVKLEEEKQYV
ncbi:chromosome segregation protein SMC [Priestia filamentosa]|uniref:chromosome segregation protein SMC n=1 Tax=Priestia filamentosa TaxID=1402861 RepID=UPI00058905C4|nr:chromosome segregation protein SMC [Priestia filamentosa]RJS67062.1 chromosome segregation protein SMC [Priestia filamentosa]WCM14741.1 chromosome segregation protein SMC [Priestia filamentosa]